MRMTTRPTRTRTATAERARRLDRIAMHALLIVALACATWAAAQHPAPSRTARIGFLSAVSAPAFANRVTAFRAGLQELGHAEGRNTVIEFRWAEEKYDRLPDLAADLVRANVDVIVTVGTPATVAARKATTTIPIVMVATGYAVASGLVPSLARPDANVTGVTILSPQLMAKRVELLKEAMPNVQTV